MSKNNEFVGIDEKYVPEDAQARTHVQEPVIGSENAQRIRESVTSGINKLTSDDSKERVKSGAKKGWKIAKRVGIGYLVFFIVIAILAITIIVAAAVNIIKAQNTSNRMMDNFNNSSRSMMEQYTEAINNH